MVSDWLAATIMDFGKNLGLSAFALNEQETAAFVLENGLRFALEHHDEELFVSISKALECRTDTLKQLLQAAHPLHYHPYPLRCCWNSRTGKAVLVVKFRDRDVTLPALEAVFSFLWKTAMSL